MHTYYFHYLISSFCIKCIFFKYVWYLKWKTNKQTVLDTAAFLNIVFYNNMTISYKTIIQVLQQFLKFSFDKSFFFCMNDGVFKLKR